MAYWHDIFKIKDILEHEYKFAGHCGKKGEKRQAKEKPTPERMELQNRLNKAKKIRRTIALNFEPNDHWITLTYAKGTHKNMDEIKEDYGKFADKMRYEYKKRGAVFKWQRIIEIGKKGGLHLHFITNRISDTDILTAKCWPHGHPYIVPVYKDGDYDYEQLASYMAKVPELEDPKHPEKSREERMVKITKENYDYSTSRNLIRPEPIEHKHYYRWTLERIIRDGPKPKEGYEIDKRSIRNGVNPVTGMSYLYYTEHLIKRKRRE